jgi:radical SAM protein with 4Fe4S-binding SPASM domain
LYYRLHNHCKLIQGATRGAIYNFHTGRVHSINRAAVELLLACHQSTVEDVIEINSPENKLRVDFLDRLTALDAGAFYLNKAPEPQRNVPPEGLPAKLDFLWLEIISNCNNKCLHCYATSGPCVNNDLMPHERWLSLIGEARQAGAAAVQLIGGEPLLYRKWRELVLKADAEGYDFIEIFTNATLVDESSIDFFKRYRVNIATTIYADNAETHDRVTLHPGSFDKTMTAVKKILAANIPLRIASIIMKANQHEERNILRLLTELGVEPTAPDVVRPTGRGSDADLLPDNYCRPAIKPPFYTDYNEFMKARQFNSCLAGKIAVTSNGEVIPCIFARNQVCGNLRTTSLAEILNGQPLQQYWRTTKDQVDKCKDCEYRYACSDCRPLAQGSDSQKRWLADMANCPYNPYTGQWENEAKK